MQTQQTKVTCGLGFGKSWNPNTETEKRKIFSIKRTPLLPFLLLFLSLQLTTPPGRSAAAPWRGPRVASVTTGRVCSGGREHWTVKVASSWRAGGSGRAEEGVYSTLGCCFVAAEDYITDRHDLQSCYCITRVIDESLEGRSLRTVVNSFVT